MKVLSKFFFVSTVAFTIVSLTGCYTELVSRGDSGYDDGANEPYYSDNTSDTTVTDSSMTINNNYYLDDNYRNSRFRLSFNYYYPYYRSSWIAGYYNSFYNDWNFGWGRPYYPSFYSYYDMDFGWGGGCLYPSPYVYDPWYSSYYYYPWYYRTYYPGYYHYPYSIAGTSATPGRMRTNGASRDVSIDRGRVRDGAPVSATSPSPVTTTRPRERVSGTAPQTTTRPARSRTETPWWERVGNTRERSSTRGESGRTGTPTTKRTREQGSQKSSPPQYRQSGRTRESNAGSHATPRRSERGRSTYSPPPQNSSPQPSYAPPSEGGSRSRSSGGSSGRKRD